MNKLTLLMVTLLAAFACTNIKTEDAAQAQEQQFWKAFGLSTIIGCSTGAVHGYIAAKTNDTLIKMLNLEGMSLPVSLVVSFLFMKHQEKMVEMWHKVIGRYAHVPQDENMTRLWGLLSNIGVFAASTKKPLVILIP